MLDENVVDSHGKHLRPRPSTPVHHPEHDERFLQQLDQKLSSLVFVQNQRFRRYGQSVAEEYPISHTPTEIKSAWVEEQHAFDKVLDDLPPTPSDDGSIPTYTSSVGGRTFASHEVWPMPELSIPSTASTMVDITPACDSHSNTITQIRSATENKLSFLESPFNRGNIIKALKDLEDQHTPTRKRKHSEDEKECLSAPEPQTQKRRLGMPPLVRFVSVGT